MNHQTSSVPQIAYQLPQVSTQPMTKSPLVDSGLAVSIFSLGDDPIACLNNAMAFLTAVASSSNATSSGGNNASGQARVVKCYNCQGEGHMARQCTQPKRPRNVVWYKDKSMLTEAQEVRQILNEEQLVFLADLGVPDGQAVQTIIPNNAAFQTEDLDTYDSDCDDISNAKAVLMANISNYGSDVISEVPHSETYLNDIENQSVHAMQDFEQTSVVDVTDNEITSDSNIIPYSQYLQETQQETVQDTTLQAQQDSMILSVIEQISHEKMINSQMDDMIKEKLALKEQVDSLEQNLSKQIKEKESLVQTFTVFKNESKEKENKYMENEIDLEKRIKELDNIIFKVGQSPQTVHMLTKPQVFYDNIHKQALGYQNTFYLKKAQRIKPTLYDGIVIFAKHIAMPMIDDEETLILEEESRSKILSEDFGKRFTPQQELSAEQAFWFQISNPTIESSNKPPIKVEVPSELPKVSLVNASLKKLKFHLAQFDSMVKKRTTPDARTEGEWGFEHTKAVFNNEIIPFLKSLKDIFNVFDKDLLNKIMEVQTVFDQMDAAVQQSSVDKQCLEIAKKELLLENDRLLQQIMSQDVLLTVMNSMSLIGESVNMERKRNESYDKCFNLDAELLKSQNTHNDLLKKFFENNDLKAQLQDKDTTICKLKKIIKSMREKSKEENVKYDYCEIETKNVELENSVAKLLLENERLCKEINHVKQVFKDQFDSIKKTLVRTKEQCDSLIDKLNLKSAKIVWK
ncbi:integrase, catalytic region, zinc finger, CCHC-type containing protein [Tanacetum coccineum]